MNATWTHRGGRLRDWTADGHVCGSRPSNLARPTIGFERFASECSIRQGVLATALPKSLSALALVSVRQSTNSSGEPKAAETRLPTRWRVRPTMLRDLPRSPTAVELSQAGRIPVQTAGLRHFAHCRDAPWNRPEPAPRRCAVPAERIQRVITSSASASPVLRTLQSARRCSRSHSVPRW